MTEGKPMTTRGDCDAWVIDEMLLDGITARESGLIRRAWQAATMKEREACASICRGHVERFAQMGAREEADGAYECGSAIRARDKEQG